MGMLPVLGYLLGASLWRGYPYVAGAGLPVGSGALAWRPECCRCWATCWEQSFGVGMLPVLGALLTGGQHLLASQPPSTAAGS